MLFSHLLRMLYEGSDYKSIPSLLPPRKTHNWPFQPVLFSGFFLSCLACFLSGKGHCMLKNSYVKFGLAKGIYWLR